MIRLLLSFLIVAALAVATPAQENVDFENMSNAEIESEASSLHPAALYLLSSRLLQEGKGQEAANWMYAGQLRYRFLLSVEGNDTSNDAVLFSALTEQVGRPVNEYIGGDVDEWLAAIDWALAWDEANPNTITSKTEHAEVLEEIRTGLLGLRADIETNRKSIPGQREANGLENR